ncbi:MAG TPA: DUF2461 domain-containing protein, partial [Fimbriimonadaceae bacterium]|nr:DUF2461 domain-containing protein [Fimbriimonadaceae bacterium]
MSAKSYFNPDTIAFLSELAGNNNKEWFEANRKRYEASVKKPMLEFAAEMIERMREVDSEITVLPKNAVFRIHRDTRFSKDKSPYKTNAGMVITRGEKHNPGVPGLYFHLDAEQMYIATGLYFLEPAQLRAVREHIAANLLQFERLLDDPVFKEHFGRIGGEKNKILPPELRDAAAQQPLLFNKQFYYWSEHKPE